MQVEDLGQAFEGYQSGKYAVHRLSRYADICEIEHALNQKIITFHTPIIGYYETVDVDGNPIRAACSIRRRVGCWSPEILPQDIRKIPFDLDQSAC